MLTIEQFSQALEQAGLACTEEEVATFFHQYDQDNSGTLTLKEFLMAMFPGKVVAIAPPAPKGTLESMMVEKLFEKTKPGQSPEKLMKKAFKNFDLNDSGAVSVDEFARVMEKFGLTAVPEAEIQEFFSSYDVDGSGELSYDEFISALPIHTSSDPNAP